MRAIICLLLFSLPAHAEKILFNLKGEQQLVEVGDGGGVTDDAEIVWRERDHGPLPADAPLGYAERYEELVEKVRQKCERKDGELICEEERYFESVPKLRENSEKKAAHLAREADRAKKRADKEKEKQDCSALLDKVKADTATAAETRKALKCVLQGNR